jgi:ribonuclease HI
LYRQINRTYKVKHPNIIGLFTQALQLMSGFTKVSIRHIPREENLVADKLATQAGNKEVKKAKQTDVLL